MWVNCNIKNKLKKSIKIFINSNIKIKITKAVAALKIKRTGNTKVKLEIKINDRKLKRNRLNENVMYKPIKNKKLLPESKINSL